MKNYNVLVNDYASSKTKTERSFHYKKDAVAYARTLCNSFEGAKIRKWPTVENSRTKQKTHMLSSDRSSCSVCGNELEGKLHCPLCGALHSYL